MLFGPAGGLPLFTLAWIGNRLVQSPGWAGMVKISSRWLPYSAYGTVMAIISLSFLFGDAATLSVLLLLPNSGTASFAKRSLVTTKVSSVSPPRVRLCADRIDNFLQPITDVAAHGAIGSLWIAAAKHIAEVSVRAWWALLMMNGNIE